MCDGDDMWSDRNKHRCVSDNQEKKEFDIEECHAQFNTKFC